MWFVVLIALPFTAPFQVYESAIFLAARHPKSFVSLDGADHLISKRRDAVYAADVIAAWAERYLDMVPEPDMAPLEGVLVEETHNGKFEQAIIAGPHRYLADEPMSAGGNGAGPSPYEYLLAALGKNSVEIFAGATPYLRLFGLVAGAAYLVEAALASHAAVASGDHDPAHAARIATARFFAENLLPAASGLERAVVSGAQSVLQAEAALVA